MGICAVQKQHFTDQNVKDLTTLRDHLLAIHAKEWYFPAWTDNRERDKDDYCGFVGCAGGHACMIKEFNDRGLTLVARDLIKMPCLTVEGSSAFSAGALQKFFGLSLHNVWAIFLPDGYDVKETNEVTKEMVAKNIDKLLSLREVSCPSS